VCVVCLVSCCVRVSCCYMSSTLSKEADGGVDGHAGGERVMEGLLAAAAEVLVHGVVDGRQALRVPVVGRQALVEVAVVQHPVAHILRHQDALLDPRIRKQLGGGLGVAAKVEGGAVDLALELRQTVL